MDVSITHQKQCCSNIFLEVTWIQINEGHLGPRIFYLLYLHYIWEKYLTVETIIALYRNKYGHASTLSNKANSLYLMVATGQHCIKHWVYVLFCFHLSYAYFCAHIFGLVTSDKTLRVLEWEQVYIYILERQFAKKRKNRIH